jgi:hypothetical protein
MDENHQIIRRISVSEKSAVEDDKKAYANALGYVTIRKEYESGLGCVAAALGIVTRAGTPLLSAVESIAQLLTPYQADVVHIELSAPDGSVRRIHARRPGLQTDGENEKGSVTRSFDIEGWGRVYGSVRLVRLASQAKRPDRMTFSDLDIATMGLICRQIAILAELDVRADGTDSNRRKNE